MIGQVVFLILVSLYIGPPTTELGIEEYLIIVAFYVAGYFLWRRGWLRFDADDL